MRKRSPRKVRNPLGWINDRLPLSAEHTQSIGLSCHSALATLLSPHANESSWAILLGSFNLSYLLAEMGLCHEHLAAISLAQDAMMEIKRQAESSGNWCCNSDDKLKQLIFDAVSVHDAQCAIATKRQMLEALKIIKTVKDGKELGKIDGK